VQRSFPESRVVWGGKMKHLLVIRNSAMGDVALTVPAVKAVLDSYPEVKITMVSHQEFAPFFEGIPRLEFFGADYKSEHKGFWGILKLRSEEHTSELQSRENLVCR